MEDADCHVLVNSRSAETIRAFLNEFLSQRECATLGWIIAEETEAEWEIVDANELIEFCIKNPHEAHAIYWHSLNEDERRHAWIFFTDDGATIYGLMCFDEDNKQEDELLERMKQFLGSEIGYVSYVEPPPSSASQYTSLFH